MNKGLIFTPKLPKEFKGCSQLIKKKHKPKSLPQMWTTKDLNQLMELRALGITYKNTAKLLGRSQGSVMAAVDSNNLYSKIDQKRDRHIAKVLNLDESLIRGRLNNKKGNLWIELGVMTKLKY